jgi:hypothetical protein
LYSWIIAIRGGWTREVNVVGAGEEYPVIMEEEADFEEDVG